MVAFASEGAEQDDHWDLRTDLWDVRFDFATSLWPLDVELELLRRFVALFVLRADLRIPRVLRRRQLDAEDEDDVASLPLLRDDYLLGAIDDEVPTLIVEAFLVLHDLLFVEVAQVALAGPDHHRDLAELDRRHRARDVDQLSRLLVLPPASLDVELHLALHLVCQASDPCLMRVVRIRVAGGLVLQIRLRAGRDGAKLADPAELLSLVVMVVLGPRHELAGDAHDVRLVLLDALRDRMLHELIEGLDLLVDDAVLVEEGIDDRPLVVDIDLVLSAAVKTSLGASITIVRRRAASTALPDIFVLLGSPSI